MFVCGTLYPGQYGAEFHENSMAFIVLRRPFLFAVLQRLPGGRQVPALWRRLTAWTRLRAWSRHWAGFLTSPPPRTGGVGWHGDASPVLGVVEYLLKAVWYLGGLLEISISFLSVQGSSLSSVFHLLGCCCFKVRPIKVLISSLQILGTAGHLVLLTGGSYCTDSLGFCTPCTPRPRLFELQMHRPGVRGRWRIQLLSSPLGTAKCDVHTWT